MKMDPKLGAPLQNHEMQRVARKFRLSLADVRKVVERVGRSRKKVYAELRKLAASRRKRNRKRG